MAVLPLLVESRAIDLIGVLVAVAFLGALGSLQRSAAAAILPDLVASSRLAPANAYLQAGTMIAVMVGSPVGGLLVSGGWLTYAFVLGAAGFAFAGTASFLLSEGARPRAPATEGSKEASGILAGFWEGVRFLQDRAALFQLTIGSTALNFFYSLFVMFGVVYVAQGLHASATDFGVLLLANSAGVAAGGLLVKPLRADRRFATAYVAAAGAAGFCVILVALLLRFTAALPLYAAIGIGEGVANTVFMTGVQRAVPPEMLGRYYSFDESVSFAAIPLAQVAGGVIVSVVGITDDYLIAGTGTVLVCLLLLLLPGVRELSAHGAPRVGAATADAGARSRE